MNIEEMTETDLRILRNQINQAIQEKADAVRAEEKAELEKSVGRYFKYEANDILNVYSTRELNLYGDYTSDVIYVETDEVFHNSITLTLRDLDDFEEITKAEWDAAKKKLIQHTVKQLEKL